MHTPKIALIGCGNIVKGAHLPALTSGPFELAYVCDLDLAKAQHIREQAGDAGIIATDDPQDIFSDPTIAVVDIATPPLAHAPLTLAALMAGKHVLCEKPSTLDVRQNRQICAAVADSGLTAQFYSSRFRQGCTPLAKELIDSGKLGRIHKVDAQIWLPRSRAADKKGAPLWFGSWAAAGGGCFMDMGQYFLDQLLHLIGWPRARRVTASMFRGIPTAFCDAEAWEVEDHMSMLAQLENNICLSMDTSAAVNMHWRWGVAIHGDKGALFMERVDSKAPLVLRTSTAGAPYEEELIQEPSPGPSDLELRLQGLIDILDGKQVPVGTSAEEALIISEITSMAYASCRAGCEVSPAAISDEALAAV